MSDRPSSKTSQYTKRRWGVHATDWRLATGIGPLSCPLCLWYSTDEEEVQVSARAEIAAGRPAVDTSLPMRAEQLARGLTAYQALRHTGSDCSRKHPWRPARSVGFLSVDHTSLRIAEGVQASLGMMVPIAAGEEWSDCSTAHNCSRVVDLPLPPEGMVLPLLHSLQSSSISAESGTSGGSNTSATCRPRARRYQPKRTSQLPACLLPTLGT